MAAADGAHEVARVTDPLSVLSVLHGVIDVDGGVLHLPECLHLVDVVETGHEAVHDKLVGALILAHDVGLPVQEVGRHLAVPALPPHLIRGVRHTLAVIEIFPAVDVHAPVVQSPAAVQFFQVATELLLDILAEALEVVGVVNLARLHLVVHLIADDGGVLGVVLHHLADDALRVAAIGGVQQVHVLSDAVVALSAVPRLRQHLGVLRCQPRGNAVGRCAEDDLDARLVQRVNDAVHPGELKLPVLRLEERPCRFAHAHHRQSSLLHQPDVFVEPVRRRVFRIVRSTVQRFVKLVNLVLSLGRSRHCEQPSSYHQ